MDKKFSLAFLETRKLNDRKTLSLSRGSERLATLEALPSDAGPVLPAAGSRKTWTPPSRASSCSSSSSSEPAPRRGAGRRRRRRQPESRRELRGDGPAGPLAGCQSRSERRDLFPERRGLPPRELRLCLGELPRPHGLAEQAGVEQGRVGGQGSGLLPLLLLEGSVGSGGGSGGGEQGDLGRCRAGGGREGEEAPRPLVVFAFELLSALRLFRAWRRRGGTRRGPPGRSPWRARPGFLVGGSGEREKRERERLSSRSVAKKTSEEFFF